MKNIIAQVVRMFLLVFVVGCGGESKTIFSESDINIIPKPLEVKFNQGAFRFTKDTKFVAEGDIVQTLEVLQDRFANAAGWNLEVVSTVPTANFV
jgi:hexosaminidase